MLQSAISELFSLILFEKIEPGAVLYRSIRILFRPICGARALLPQRAVSVGRQAVHTPEFVCFLVKDIKKSNIRCVISFFFVYLNTNACS